MVQYGEKEVGRVHGMEELVQWEYFRTCDDCTGSGYFFDKK